MPGREKPERTKRFPVRIRLVDWNVLSIARIPASPLIRELVSGYIGRDPRLRDLKTYLEESATKRETTTPTPGGARDPAPGQDQVQDMPHLLGSPQDFQDQDFQDQDQVDQVVSIPGPQDNLDDLDNLDDQVQYIQPGNDWS